MEWLERIVSVMDIISTESMEGIGISELSKRTLLGKGTLHRMLQGMVEHKLLMKHQETRKYSLGPKAMVWGSKFLAGHDPIELLREQCDVLAQRTGLYTYLSRFDSGQVYCIYTKQPSDIRHTYFVHVGQRMPLYCTAAAKAIFAFQAPDIVESVFLRERQEKFTMYTKTNIEEIKTELSEVAKTKVAFCQEEMEPNVVAIATPVFHNKNEIAASIGLIGAAAHINQNREFLIKELIATGERASNRMESAYLLASTKLV